MATVACPYCYHLINQGKLAYQCLGRGVPGGSRCAKREDERRQQLTDVRTAAYPTFVPPTTFVTRSRRLFGSALGRARMAACPHCGGRTGVRACPSCHTPLSSIFADSRSPLVGMVGGKGAGKTVYLSVLHHELRTTVRRRFQADIRLTGDQQGGAGSPRQWLQNYEEQLFTHGRLFEQTAGALNGVRAPVVVEWRQPKRRLGRQTFGTTVLSFYDAAGEDLSNQDRVHTQAYLGGANGLVLLLDPWQLPGAMNRIEVPASAVREAEAPLEVLNRITELLRVSHNVKASRRVKVPLATPITRPQPALVPSSRSALVSPTLATRRGSWMPSRAIKRWIMYGWARPCGTSSLATSASITAGVCQLRRDNPVAEIARQKPVCRAT